MATRPRATHDIRPATSADADAMAARILDLALGEGDAEPRDDIAVVAIKLPSA